MIGSHHSATCAATPQCPASLSIASSRMRVLSTSKQTASALRQTSTGAVAFSPLLLCTGILLTIVVVLGDKKKHNSLSYSQKRSCKKQEILIV